MKRHAATPTKSQTGDENRDKNRKNQQKVEKGSEKIAREFWEYPEFMTVLEAGEKRHLGSLAFF